MYGYDHPDELLGESWKVLYDEDGGRWMEQHTMPALEKEGYWQGEAIGKRRDGSTFPQEVSVTRVEEKFICLVRDITWRKEAERRLARLASYPELNPSPIVEVDSSKRLTYANPVAERLFPDLRVSGVDHPILAGYEDLNARFRESTDDVLLDKTRVGKRFYQRVLSQVPGENLYRIYCVDITTRRQIERDLRKNEATLYEAQRVANIGSWEYSLREDWATWSDQTYRIFGLSPGEPTPTYKQFVEFVHPDDRRALDRALKASLGDESSQSLDFRIIRTDGEVRWVNAQYEIAYDARTIPQRAVGTLHDITDRKLVEERLRESEASLIEAQRLAALGSWEAEPARPGLGTAEHGMRWSDEMFRLFGYAPQEFAPTFKDLVRATHPEDREHVKQKMRDSASRGESPVVVEHRIVRPDGEVRFLQAQIEMVYGLDGKLNRNFGTVLDVTRRKRAEEAQSRLAAIVESSQQDAVFSETLDGIIESWNTGAEELYGYSAEEIVGQHISILTPPDLPDDAPETLNRVSLGDSVESRETVRVKKGGERLEISLTVSPMKDASGNIIGASTIARDITGRRALERQLEYQAFHDTLTGLPNRALLEDRIQHALTRIGRREEYVALLFMDLDDFKVVNDSLGHLLGDQLLVAVSRRLESVVRAEDTVARFGGDEFVILLEDTERAGEAAQVAGRIVETLRMPFLLGKEEVSTSVSIGISYGLFGQDSFEELLRQADVAMYEVKTRSKGGYRIFEQRMGTRATERQTLGNDLRRALEREELVLHYQTKVEIETEDIVGSEALVRWNHPERGLLSPGEFVPLAEETGLIIPVGRWVFREACRQAKSWHEQHLKSSPMLVCVNVSAQEFQVPGLVEEMCRSISETGVNPAYMELEITESALMRYVEGTLRTLKEIRDLGMKIAIDDFGTGYSSLSYLQRFPADYLKIDRSFVNELDGSSESWAFISMIVDLARSLGMKTVAEGVETESQLSQLKEIGCDMAQGYYFTKPRPVNEIQAIIAENYNL